MQGITNQLAKNKSLLSDLVRVGRMDQHPADRHIESGELLASHGMVLELRANRRRAQPQSFKIQLSGIVVQSDNG